MNPYQYIVSFAKGVGGIIRDASLILRPNFNDMANLSLTSPSNGSAVFNGTSDYVQNTSNLDDQLNSDFSVGAWVNNKITGAALIFQTNTTAGTKIIVGARYNDLGAFFGVTDGTTTTWKTSGGARATGAWDYVVATYVRSSNTLNLFVNGSNVTTASGSVAGFGPSINKVTIGRRDGDNDLYFSGNLANVAVWNRALTSDEINSIMWKRYDLLTAGESTGLVAWYALDDITGTSVPDSTGTYNATAY